MRKVKARNFLASQLLAFKKIKHILTKGEVKWFYIFLVLMLFGMIFESLGIGLIAPVIKVILEPDILSTNNYLTGVIQFLGISNYKSLIITSFIFLGLIYFFKNLFLTYFTWFRINYLANLRMNLSNRMFKMYLSQPYTFHLQRNSAQLIQNTINECNVFTGRILAPITVILSESLVVLGITTLLLFIEPFGSLISILFLFIIVKIILSLSKKHIARWGKERQFHDGKKIQHLQQGLGGVKDVLILGKTEHFLSQFQIHNLLGKLPEQKQAFVQEVPRFLFEVLAVLSLMIIVLSMTIQDKETSTILATLAIFGAAAFRLMPSITRILAAIQSVRYGLPVLDSIAQELSLSNTVTQITSSNKMINSSSSFKDKLVMKNVVFSYPETSLPSLKNSSLEIKRGECIGIIGPSGSGKSTLVDIILGLLKPDIGAILLDDKDIHSNLRSWQGQIGYVPQFIFLLDDSLRNNIAFGDLEDDIDDTLIQRAIETAQLSEFVRELPKGINTEVGERGVRLSGGQRQRIGIARALYQNPGVVVLDEATSSLDYNTEKRIMDTVYKINKDKTVIIIAHRVSTLQDCDRIYRLEGGKIIEEGESSSMLK